MVSAIGISLGGTTGYAINPVRDFIPRIAHYILPISGKGDSKLNYSWIPVLGPLVGGVLGVSVSELFFVNTHDIYLRIPRYFSFVYLFIHT